MDNVWANPVFGIGLNDWARPEFMFSTTVDNFWLLAAMRFGIPGFLLLAGGYLIGLAQVIRRDFSADTRLRQIRLGWVFTFLGMTFTLSTVALWTNIYSFVFFMFAAGMWLITAQPAGAPAAAPGPPGRRGGGGRAAPGRAADGRPPGRRHPDPRPGSARGAALYPLSAGKPRPRRPPGGSTADPGLTPTPPSPPFRFFQASGFRMTLPTLGVVLVTFNSTDVILDCVESLLAAQGVALSIVVVDNGSTDGTPALLRDWAAGRHPYAAPEIMPFPLVPAAKPVTLQAAVPATAPDGTAEAPGHTVTLIETGLNSGFAGGVNRGLAALAAVPWLDRFWVLNPDSAVPPGTARAFATHPAPPGGFALMGGRVTYLDRPDVIQIDGGKLNGRTGVTDNLNLFGSHAATPPPDPARFDFITGASMVASRQFYETAGPMAEDYFLYYEEVDWALRRGSLPLLYCPGALVYHVGGTAIGSPVIGRLASTFSLYFKHRGRMRFLRRHRPKDVVTGQAFSVAKAAQLLFKGYPAHARAILAGAADLAPPSDVRNRLSPAAAALAFGKPPRNG